MPRSLSAILSHSGYGYQVRIVENLESIDKDMTASLQWALSEIKKIQEKARSGNPIIKPRWPVLIIRTPKVSLSCCFEFTNGSVSLSLQGWTGPKELHGEYIEGSFRSHGVPLPNAGTDDYEFDLLSDWLWSYKPDKLFKKDGTPIPKILSIIPENPDKRMGQRKETYMYYVALNVPDWKEFVVQKLKQESCMQSVGELLHDVIAKYVLDVPFPTRVC